MAHYIRSLAGYGSGNSYHYRRGNTLPCKGGGTPLPLDDIVKADILSENTGRGLPMTFLWTLLGYVIGDLLYLLLWSLFGKTFYNTETLFVALGIAAGAVASLHHREITLILGFRNGERMLCKTAPFMLTVIQWAVSNNTCEPPADAQDGEGAESGNRVEIEKNAEPLPVGLNRP